ncbi:hypothetical protein GQ54DRAFT_112043 [Martensiomyces pterosporus]|nr:hypothetical protein GQ54DRAFT_112043 [Martensiomyces pterosporus]
MAFLDELPLDILLAVVQWLVTINRSRILLYELLPVASVSTSLRRPLLPLLYRDLVFEFTGFSNVTYHTAALANSAGCSEYAQCVLLRVNEFTTPDDIVRVVRDDVDAGNETKWPNLRSYSYNYLHEYSVLQGSLSCSDIIRQLDKELPKLRQAFPVHCGVSSGIVPLAYTLPSVSFLLQLTTLYLTCDHQCIDANRLPQLFAPTLIDLTLDGANTENVWNLFYDGHENQAVVFARLWHLSINFEHPSNRIHSDDLPPHLQGATNDVLAKRSVWTAGAASGRPGCRVPLFPVLRTFKCEGMTYNFRDFISRTQCHNSLATLYVKNQFVYFDFDTELFKNLITVVFNTRFWGKDQEFTGTVDLCKSAFTSLLHTKTNIQKMVFKADVRDTLFQVPPDIGCTNLRSLVLGVEVDFKSMLRLLSNLKHLVELVLDVSYYYIYNANGRQEDAGEYIDKFQSPQAEYPPVSSTLRRFICRLHSPGVRRCYTASYAVELALHLPALETMTLGVDEEHDVAFYEALLGLFLQELSGSPYMNDGLMNAKVTPRYLLSWHNNYWLR